MDREDIAQRIATPPTTAPPMTPVPAVAEFTVSPRLWLARLTKAGADRLAQWFVNPGRSADAATRAVEEISRRSAGEPIESVDSVEYQLAVKALRLQDRTVQQIMQPRIEIDAADVNTPPGEVLGVLAMAGFSRLPVYDGDLDHILGYVHMKDALRQHYLGWAFDLRKLLRPALFVPATMRVGQLLVTFQEARSPLAIVVDEYGGTKGLVTLEHSLAELVGDISRQKSPPDNRIVRRSATSWLVDGSVPIYEFLERTSRSHLLPSAPRNVNTIAGLILAEIGHIPAVGEATAWHDLRFEVVEIDGQRIQRVLATHSSAPAGNPPHPRNS